MRLLGLGLLLGLLLPAGVQAQFTFTTNNGAITITGYTGPGGAVTIPSIINGLSVTTIGSFAFYSTSLTSVTMPTSITNIGNWAFESCSSLTGVTIPDSVTSIGKGAFSSCASLTAITVDTNNPAYSSVAGVLLNKSQTVLVQCPGRKSGSYTIPDNVTNIGNYAFIGCTNIYTVVIPNSTTSIGISAFYYCISLTSVTIPDSVTSIGNGAFVYCTSLNSVTIGSSITNIGSSTFTNCYSLMRVYFQGNAPGVGLSAFSGDTNATVYYLLGTTGWSATFDGRPTALLVPYTYYTNSNGTITVTGCVTNYGGAVTIPSTVNGLPVSSIGSYAFQNSGLASVMIPDSITNIGNWAFQNCRRLPAITVDALNSSYSSADGVLFNQSQTTLIQCPGGKPGSYTVPNSVTDIRSLAFAYCFSLTGVTIPDSVTSIGDGAFYSCPSMTAITVSAVNPFYSSVDGVLFNKNQTLLIQCPALKAGSYTVPNSVTNIGIGAFYSCINLTSVTIGNGVTTIGSFAFDHCYGLTNITVGSGVTSIGDYAFYRCDNLTGVYFRGNAPSAGVSIFGIYNSGYPSNDYDSKATVYYLSWTTGWSYSSTWPSSYPYGNGRPVVLWNPPPPGFYASNGTLTKYIGSDGAVIIPDTIDGLPVSRIGSSAFASCYSLTNVTIPSSVTNIGNSAFSSCTNLTSVTIPNSVTSIGNSAFSSCRSLTNITLPSSVISIGDQAFYQCTKLKGVYFLGNAPSLGGSFVFFFTSPTVYYLPGTTNWGATYGGRPTALWKPSMLTRDASFGVQTNQFGFNVTWASGQTVVVEACADLANPVWTPLQTNTLTGDAFYFSDPQWTNHPARLYRLRSP